MSDFLKWLLRIRPEDLAAGDSWRIGLQAEYNNYVNLSLIAVLIAMVYLTIRSYRREGDASRGAKSFLAGLRIVVIVLTLLALFRPAIFIKRINTLRSTVLVLLDDSMSMSNTDRYVGDPGRGALAKFLGVAPEELEKFSRIDMVRKALLRKDGALAKLAEQHPIVLVKYSTSDPARSDYTRSVLRFGAKPSTESGQDDQAPGEAEKVRVQLTEALAGLGADGFETNLARALYDALEMLQGRRVAGVVMISDGQATAEGNEKAIRAETLRAAKRGWPLLAVLVGDDKPPTNVGVSAMQVRDRVSRKTELAVEARLTHQNLGDKTVTVRLVRRKAGSDEEWSQVGEAQDVKLVREPDPDYPDDERRSIGTQPVRFTAPTPEAGEFIYRVVVAPVPDERDPADNLVEAPVSVTDERINVLLVSAGAGWEFQYLRNLLLRQDDYFRVSVWQQNADKDVNQLASDGMQLKKLPGTLEELMGSPSGKPYPGYQVVILYDPIPSQAADDNTRGMTPLAKILPAYVGEHGRGLCYVAGNKNTDAMLDPQGAFTPLAKMLPVVLRPNTINVSERISSGQPTPWQLQLTSYGLDHPVTALGGASEEAKDIWPLLPGVFWSHPVLRVRPMGRVLAQSGNSLRRIANGDPEPVIVTQPYGTGRVLYVGTEGTWRWRYRRDAMYHRKFWINVVQYLASPRARQVVILAGGDTFDAGKKIKIEVKAYDDQYQALRDKTFKVEMISQPDGQRRTLELQAVDVEKKPGSYETTITIKKAGKFQLTALWGDKDRQKKVQDKTITVRVPQAEGKRPEANPAMLSLVSSEPGNFLRLRQFDQLARRIHSDPRKAAREDTREIWDTNMLLALIVLLLTIEWVLRKKYNMT